MNLLPHKSWHVWNRDNVERVQHDEAEAAAKERERQTRVDQADHEARLDVLRRLAQGQSEADAGAHAAADHVNLFFAEEAEARQRAQKRPNEEYEAEANAKKRKDERLRINYLGEGSAELAEKKPWYSELPPRPGDAEAASAPSAEKPSSALGLSKEDRARRRLERTIQREDPLTDVKKYLHIKAAHDVAQAAKTSGILALPAPPPVRPAVKGPASGPPAAAPAPSLDKLRQERLQREAEERARVAQLKAQRLGLPMLPSASASAATAAAAAAAAAGPQRYNQQFNPQLARGGRPSGPGAGGYTRYSDKYRQLLAEQRR